MPVSLRYMREAMLAGMREAAMTIFHPTSAGLLGGQPSLTAHSSITDPSAREALFNAQVAQQQAQMLAAQAQESERMAAQIFNQGIGQAQAQAPPGGIVYYSTGADGITFSSTSGGFTGGFTYASAAATKKSTEAVARSMELLYDWLTPEQRKQLAIYSYFDVIGGDTGIKYRLYPPSNYNIHQLVKDSNETEVKLCFEPKDKSLPKGDIWLCQKLALELDERATLEIANRSATYFG